MRYRPPATSLALLAAFAVGIVVSPLARRVVPAAHGQSPAATASPAAAVSPAVTAAAALAPAAPVPVVPAMIDLLTLKYEDLPPTGPEMHAKALVTTEHGTVAIQVGNVAKHIHMGSDELQYIIEGSGTMWLGNERKAFKPGTLIIIPKGVPHAGTIVTSGPVKALSIKMPPQGKTDVTFVN